MFLLYKKLKFLTILPILFAFGCGAPSVVDTPSVEVTHQEEEQKVDIYIDGQLFTSYMYGHPLLNKAVLFPVVSADGHTVTRGYPLATREGESTDHTHQHGVWLNHGHVNGIDFWNAGRTPPVDGVRYGRIVHQSFLELQSGETGSIKVLKHWLDDTGKHMLNEETLYQFEGGVNKRVITMATTLTAIDEDIEFTDSKEAFFAIRVAKELEIIDGQPATYLNSEGIEGYPDVWGQRASWMQLKGEFNNSPVSVLMFDAPNNVNHPPHWMARDYGLFAVNNLGSAAYTNGNETLNFTLMQGQSETFNHQIVIIDGGDVDAAQIQTLYDSFVDLQE